MYLAKFDRHPKRKIIFPSSSTSFLKTAEINAIKSSHISSKLSSPRTNFAVDCCKETLLEFSYLTSTLSSENLILPEVRVHELYHPISFVLMPIHSYFKPTLNLLHLLTIKNHLDIMRKDLLIIFILNSTIINDSLLHSYFHLLIFLQRG